MRSRKGWMVVAVVTLGLSAAACSDDDDEPTVIGDGGVDAITSNLNQNQAVGLMMQINSSEVAEAQVAQARGQAATVRAYAARMITDHQASNNQLTADLVTADVVPTDSDERRELQNDTDNQVQSLWSASTAKFDQQYINSQVNEHQDTLSLIDTKILPAITNPTLLNDALALRAVVVQHLQLAQSIQTLLGTPEANTTSSETETGTGTTGSETSTGTGTDTGTGTNTATATGQPAM